MRGIERYGNRTGSRAQTAAPRVVVAKQRPAGWWRGLGERMLAVARDRRVWVAAALVVAVLSGVFAFAWVDASRTIEAYLVDGRVDMKSGVYAAPLVVRRGQPLDRDDLVSYLQFLGYASAADADAGVKGRFSVEGNTVTIEPLDEAVLAAGRYAPLAVEFSGKRGVRRVLDARTGKPVEQGLVEPLLISSSFGTREKRTRVAFEALPEALREAVVATEDRRFWRHHGVDYRGIARAVRENMQEGEIVEGGSTITQQVVKNVFLTPERSYTRKLREALMAFVLESKLSKEEIFTIYANEIYLGQSGTYAVHGFAEAANRYFGKDLSALTLDEAALLAGIIQAPNSNSPYRHPERAKERRDLVLDMMVESGAVTREEAEAAKARPIEVVPARHDSAWLDAPYFNDYVREYLEEVLGGDGTPAARMRVQTTIDINLQRAAAEVVDRNLKRLDAVLAKGKNGVPPGTVQAALVAVDARSGAVLAMVGGRDYAASQLNRATSAMRQPGSVFKPIVYATAIATRSFTPASPVLDAPQKFTYGRNQVYEPSNYGQAYANKEISLRTALRYSKNVPTVEVAMRTGLSAVAETAARAGLPRPDAYPSMALGTSEATPLQMAEAYTSFANGGEATEPTPIAGAEDAEGVYIPRPKSRTVFSPAVAYVMTDMLADVVDGGTGAGVRARGVKGAVAGKTGTSRDGWFAGYTPNMVVVVWVGFDDGSQLGITGADSALPIWADFVRAAVAFRPDLGGEQFARPAGIVTATVCDETGQLAGEFCPATHQEIFVSGSEPGTVCLTHSASVAEALVPLFDEEGNFIGYGSPEDAEVRIPSALPGFDPDAFEAPEADFGVGESASADGEEAGDEAGERGRDVYEWGEEQPEEREERDRAPRSSQSPRSPGAPGMAPPPEGEPEPRRTRGRGSSRVIEVPSPRYERPERER